tara:strand:+ start:4292 stop:5863 length:1572 start_codon:yes stop_codon:yes gene_type:complete
MLESIIIALSTVIITIFSQKICVYLTKVNNNSISNILLNLISYTSYGKNLINKKLDKAKVDLQNEFINNDIDVPLILDIPDNSMTENNIIERLNHLQKNDCKWKDGRAFGYIYHGGDDHSKLLNKAYEMYAHTNPLHTSAFLSTRILEAEVIRMTAKMLNGSNQVCGTMTSGGSESIILAVKSARDRFLSINPTRKPEMICCNTVHAAFVKAAKYFNIKLIITKLDEEYRSNPELYSRNINKNTMMIVVSAPCYPYGVIDRIEDISEIAFKNNIWLHVDACLGGFLLPWLNDIGYNIPKFDFRLKGVTTMSCDTHKFGYCSKGTSVVLYKNADYRKYQYFCWSKWTGGLFASPSITGSRPGGLIAAAWTSLVSIGKDGFKRFAKQLMDTRNKLIEEINNIEELEVIGNPDMCVFAIKSISPNLNIFVLGDKLEYKKWFIERQQNPNSLHFTITLRHINIIDEFISDLKKSIDESKGIKPDGKAAIYGNAVSITCPEVIDEILLHYVGIVNDSIDNCGILAIEN